MSTTWNLNSYERELLSDVEESGWRCVCVFDPDGNDPTICYSVGFTKTLSAPEFIIIGLDSDLMHAMLWEIFRQLQANKDFEDGTIWKGLIRDYDCVSKRVHPSNIIADHLNSAMWFWREALQKTSALPAFQIVWPGSHGIGEGLFPWDDGCDWRVKAAQPPLYLPHRNLS